MSEAAETPSALPQNLPAPHQSDSPVWKKLLPFLLILPGLAAMAFALLADMFGFGGLPGFGARQMSIVISGFAILLAGLVLLLPAGQKFIGEWLLIGTATLAVSLSADLMVINTGLSGMLDKQAMMAVVVFSVLVARTGPMLLAPAPFSRDWRKAAATDWPRAGRILAIIIQLGLLVLLIGEYSLENEVFSHNIMRLTFYGFLIHLLLPARYRLSFFLLISIAAINGVFGWTNGIWLIGLGLALIGIGHLPIRFPLRIGLLLATGIALAALRIGWLYSPWSSAIWPILGSMFMFRLIVYLYDLKHQKEPFVLSRTLAYFFLLPNIVFPLFPVVDYSTFRRTYYNEEPYKIYQVGVSWVFRGAFHLILYRFVSYYLLIAPEDVTNAVDLVRYLVSNILLYLRVSGQFHIVVGMLHLFGFNLPETHHLYFLASSFTDYWRRINIYWKDFMLKVFYYPFFFQLRKWNSTSRLVVSTLFVFFMTWLLHAYQWFWLRGTFLLTPQDMLFWTILALLVVANSLYEVKRGRKRSLGKRAMTFGEIGSLAVRTVGTFAVICVLWSLWTSVSLSEWLALWSIPTIKMGNVTSLFPYLVVFAFIGGSLRQPTGSSKTSGFSLALPVFVKTSALTGLSILLLYLAGNPLVYSHFGGKTQEIIRDLRATRLNAQDADLLERGYYEDLIGVNRFNSQLWEIYMKRPQNRPDIFRTEAGQFTNNFLKGELIPSSSTIFFNKKFSVNQWGMRDREYTLHKSPGAYRVALVGASIPMGWGVGDGETFEALLEERLNRENSQGGPAGYEILNFSVEGYNLIQNLYVLQNKAISFEPDALFFIAHPKDGDRVITDLFGMLRSGIGVPYEKLQEIIALEEIDSQTPETLAKRRLKLHSDEIVLWAYSQMVAESQERGILPVFVLLPRIVGVDEPDEVAHQITLAEKAGFTVLDLSDVYQGQDTDAILLASWDWHPNARGHQLIAERLYLALQAKGMEIPFGRPVR